MIAVDTNILVRLLIDDSDQKEQVKVAREFASKTKQLFIPQVVSVELVWVLKSAYQLEKKDIILVLEHLLYNRSFELQAEDCFHQALELFKNSTCDFSDCLIAIESHQANCSLITFDKKLSRLSGVDLL